jgi:hypothetical protein
MEAIYSLEVVIDPLEQPTVAEILVALARLLEAKAGVLSVSLVRTVDLPDDFSIEALV